MTETEQWLYACLAMSVACAGAAPNRADPVQAASTAEVGNDKSPTPIPTPNVPAAEKDAPSEGVVVADQPLLAREVASTTNGDVVETFSRDSRVPAPSSTSPARGGLANHEIRAEVRRHFRGIRYCYEHHSIRHGTFVGKVETSFTIGPDGNVIAVKARGFPDKSVEDCIVGIIKIMKFPRPEGGGVVVVSYPFNFEAAE